MRGLQKLHTVDVSAGGDVEMRRAFDPEEDTEAELHRSAVMSRAALPELHMRRTADEPASESEGAAADSNVTDANITSNCSEDAFNGTNATKTNSTDCVSFTSGDEGEGLGDGAPEGAIFLPLCPARYEVTQEDGSITEHGGGVCELQNPAEP